MKFTALTYKQKSLFLVAIMTVVMIVIAINVYKVLSQSTEGTQKISRSLDNLDRLQEVLTVMVNAETSARGFIITKKEDFLSPYGEAVSQLKNQLSPDSLYQMMPEHILQIKRLNDYIQLEMDYLDKMIVMAKIDSGSTNKMNLIVAQEGKHIMDNIRLTVSSLYASESHKLDVLNKNQQENNSDVITVLISGLIVCMILLIVFYLMVTRNTAMRNRVEKDLLAAKEYAEDATNAKTQFLATVSHGVRSPLNGVIGNTSMLMQTSLNAEQKKYAQTIHRSSIALLSIVNDILDFSKIESGSLELENLPFVFRYCITEVFALIGTTGSEIKMSYFIDPEIPVLIVGDVARLWQVLINLLGNAINTIPDGGNITLQANLLSSGTDEIKLGFTITGTGVSSQKADSLYIDFPHEDIPVSRQHSASGLGLSISSRIIALMGGTIKVSSLADKTTVTNFSIKAKQVTDELLHVSAANDLSNEKIDSNLSKKMPLNILLADDNQMNQVLFASVLLTMGYTCNVAINGSEALAMAVEDEYDIIFMDIFMPVMDGIEATKLIRQYYMNNDSPVIIGVTANVLLGEKEKCLAAGMNDFLTKPYNSKTIENILIRWGDIKQMLKE